MVNNFSRRDFIKVAGAALGASALSILPPVKNTLEAGADYVEREMVLDSVQKQLVRSEYIPPEIMGLPDKNSHFEFADILLDKSINEYRHVALEKGFPMPYYERPERYFDPFSGENMAELGGMDVELYEQFMSNLIKDFLQAEDKQSFIASYPGRWAKTWQDLTVKNLLWFRRKLSDSDSFAHAPFLFSEEKLYGIHDVVNINPGSPILDRINQKSGLTTSDQIMVFDREKLIEALHEEVDPIWNWVDKERGSGLMGWDKILTHLLEKNRGDVRGSIADATLISKLAARNHPVTYEFNVLPESQREFEEMRANSRVLSQRTKDHFAPRLSANVINGRQDLDIYFGQGWGGMERVNGERGVTHLCGYSALGDIYHGLNTMLLIGETRASVVTAMIFQKYFLQSMDIQHGITQSFSSFGADKIAADFLVAYRGGEIQKILRKIER